MTDSLLKRTEDIKYAYAQIFEFWMRIRPVCVHKSVQLSLGNFKWRKRTRKQKRQPSPACDNQSSWGGKSIYHTYVCCLYVHVIFTTEKVTKDTWCAIFTWQKLAAGAWNKWWLRSCHSAGTENLEWRHIQITYASSIYKFGHGVDSVSDITYKFWL